MRRLILEARIAGEAAINRYFLCDEQIHQAALLRSKINLPHVVLKGVRGSDKRQKESPPVESRGSEQTPLHSKLVSERSLGAAGSTPSPRLGQQFMSKGLSV